MVEGIASVMWRVGLVMAVLIGKTYTWIPDVDCLTVDGTEGRCTAPSNCAPFDHGLRPHYCRYSRGYGTRICCPRPLSNSVSKELPDDFYESDESISFPSESSNLYRPSNSRPQSSNNPLLFNEDSDFQPYNPRPSNNRPQSNNEPNYGNQYNNPSQGYHPSSGNNYNNPQQGNSPSYGNEYSNPQGNSPSYGNEYSNPQGNWPSSGNNYNPQGSRPSSGNNYNNQQGSRPSSGNNYNNPQGNRPSSGNNYNNQQGSRPSSGNNYNNPQGSRPSSGNNYNNQQGNRPSSGNNYNNPSYGNQGRPNNNDRPQPGVWEIPGGGSQSQHGKRTTARPIWEVEGGRETSTNSNKRISELKCEEYSASVSESIGVLPLSINAEAVPLQVQKCDFSAVKLIVGGEAADLGEFPHMAAVGFQSRGSRNILWNCGGTLISDRYVMTAAHCINTTYGNPVVVRLGEYNIARDNDGAEPADYRVERIVVHPNYAKSYKYNDIALIRLSRSVTFNKGIRPACLFTENSIKSKPTATGWGRTDFVGKQSDILMKVNLNIIDNRQCNSYYSTNNPGSQSFNKGIVDTMLCAGEIQGGRDTCLGDSGGPLTVTKRENPCIHYVVGITSFGKVCGAPQSPGVYTKVSKYLSWIERTVWQ